MREEGGEQFYTVRLKFKPRGVQSITCYLLTVGFKHSQLNALI